MKPPLVLRQPPPPIRPPLVLQKPPPNNGGSPEENNTENCSKVAARTRPFSFRRCKSRKILLTTNIESLPAELIFEILVRVPAKDIYNATRFVCRKWYKIIHTHDFIHAHLHQSECGLLTLGAGLFPSFLASGEGLTTEISKLNYTFTNSIMFMSSCNGLVLELHHQNSFDICITNPITLQNFALPPFFTNAIQHGYAIAYAATSMDYKVVRAFFKQSFFKPRTFESEDEHVAILTVGVDKDWTRRVNTRHLSPTAKKLLLSEPPFTTEGFVHWTQNDNRSKYVLTLNVETEVFTHFALPTSLHHPHDGENHEIIHYYYLPMGDYLSLLIARSKFSWESWEMKPETGEWTKLLNIDLEAQFANDLNCTLTPGGWLKFREVLVFCVSYNKDIPAERTRFFISCNVRTCEFQLFVLKGGTRRFLAHRNSLEWLVG